MGIHPVISAQDVLQLAKHWNTAAKDVAYHPNGPQGPAYSIFGKNNAPLGPPIPASTIARMSPGLAVGHNLSTSMDVAAAGQQPPVQPPQPAPPPAQAPPPPVYNPQAPAPLLRSMGRPSNDPTMIATSGNVDENGANRAGLNGDQINVTGPSFDAPLHFTGTSRDTLHAIHNILSAPTILPSPGGPMTPGPQGQQEPIPGQGAQQAQQGNQQGALLQSTAYNPAPYQQAIQQAKANPQNLLATTAKAGAPASTDSGYTQESPEASEEATAAGAQGRRTASAQELASEAAANKAQAAAVTIGSIQDRYGNTHNPWSPKDPVVYSDPNPGGMTWYEDRTNPGSNGLLYTEKPGSYFWQRQRLYSTGSEWSDFNIQSDEPARLLHDADPSLPIDDIQKMDPAEVRSRLKYALNRTMLQDNPGNADLDGYRNMVTSAVRLRDGIDAMDDGRFTKANQDANANALASQGARTHGRGLWDGVTWLQQMAQSINPWAQGAGMPVDQPLSYLQGEFRSLAEAMRKGGFSTDSNDKLNSELTTLRSAWESGDKASFSSALDQFINKRKTDADHAVNAALLNWKRVRPQDLDMVNAWKEGKEVNDRGNWYPKIGSTVVEARNNYDRNQGDPKTADENGIPRRPKEGTVTKWRAKGTDPADIYRPKLPAMAKGGIVLPAGNSTQQPMPTRVATSGPVQVNSTDQWLGLPPGTVYRDSRGNIARKSASQMA